MKNISTDRPCHTRDFSSVRQAYAYRLPRRQASIKRAGRSIHTSPGQRPISANLNYLTRADLDLDLDLDLDVDGLIDHTFSRAS